MGNFLNPPWEFSEKSIRPPNQFHPIMNFRWPPFRDLYLVTPSLYLIFAGLPHFTSHLGSVYNCFHNGASIWSSLSELIPTPEFSMSRYSVANLSIRVNFSRSMSRTITKSSRSLCSDLVLSWVLIGFNFANSSSRSPNSFFIFTLASRSHIASEFLKFAILSSISIIHCPLILNYSISSKSRSIFLL